MPFSAAVASSSEDNLSDDAGDESDSPTTALGVPLPSPPSRVDIEEESRSSGTGDLGHIRNVLIAASEDLGPMGRVLQQTTTDQNHPNQGK